MRPFSLRYVTLRFVSLCSNTKHLNTAVSCGNEDDGDATDKGGRDAVTTATADGEESGVKAGTRYDDGIRIVEGLAATGLRSIRFALEIPGERQVN